MRLSFSELIQLVSSDSMSSFSNSLFSSKISSSDTDKDYWLPWAVGILLSCVYWSIRHGSFVIDMAVFLQQDSTWVYTSRSSSTCYQNLLRILANNLAWSFPTLWIQSFDLDWITRKEIIVRPLQLRIKYIFLNISSFIQGHSQ